MGIVDLIGITAIVALFAIFSAGFLFVLFAVRGLGITPEAATPETPG